MDKTFFSVFKTFFKIGLLLLGGGYVILPLLQSELVDKKKWITSDELVQYYAISTSLPGIIAANTAIFTGRKLLKTKGAIAALLGVILPAFIAIILLASIFNEIVRYNFVKYMFWGVGIGVITLLFLAVAEMWKKCIVDKFSVAVYTSCVLLALLTDMSPAIIVIFAVVLGIVHAVFFNKKQEQKYD